MHDSETSFEHVISSVDYPTNTRDARQVIPFLDQELRPKAKHSITEEYPALFGDFPGGSSLFIEKDGRVASHVGLLVREFLHADFRLRIGLIGSVATSSIFRGMGMASSLLKTALLDLRLKRCALAVLWSNQPEFYLPLGFHRAGREVDFRLDPAHVPDYPETSRLFDPSKDVAGLWRLYRRHELKIDRSLEEMNRLTKIPETAIYVTERNGQVTSYIVIGKGTDFSNYIHEWAGEMEAVVRNVAYTQKHHYPKTPLVLIAPGSMDLMPLKQMAKDRWEGVVGLVKILDRATVLRAFEAFLKGRGVPFTVKDQGQEIEMQGQTHSLRTDKEYLKVILGDDASSKHLTLPFFLWGFDSI